ncbi:MAG TPA: hypothetical protein VFU84_01220 [Gaiellaceae bacterium]|nr:hypothetical protein [Gaiellaceae bacterium]
MKRDALAGARFLALPTIALVAVAFLAPGRAEVALRVYALLLSATLIVLLLLALRRAYPDETPLREPGPAAPSRSAPPSLARIEQEVALGVAGSFDLHYRLVPRLRSVAAGLLDARRNLSLTASPDRARALLGDEAWVLVRPDRATPPDRLGPGIAQAELRRVVDALEAI